MKYNISDLIPQRAPILMVDNLLEVAPRRIVTELTIKADNYFVENGALAETGLLEHIAQTASALAGYLASIQGATCPPVGYIAEIKEFLCASCPRVGDVLQTTIVLENEVGNISVISGETHVQGKTIATTQMKIYIRPTN